MKTNPIMGLCRQGNGSWRWCKFCVFILFVQNNFNGSQSFQNQLKSHSKNAIVYLKETFLINCIPINIARKPCWRGIIHFWFLANYKLFGYVALVQQRFSRFILQEESLLYYKKARENKKLEYQKFSRRYTRHTVMNFVAASQIRWRP